MSEVEKLVERLNGHRVYHIAQAAGQGYSPLSTATGHTELARVLSEAAAALQSQARRVEELAQDVIALAEHCGELADMHDGPCYVFDGLCAASVCQSVGCIKDKADRARSVLSEGEKGR